MSEKAFLDTPEGRRIAYNKTPGKGPGVVFLGGFRSDMEGTKAVHLEAWAREQDRAFLRFDYSGHGQSSGGFEDGAIGDWLQDAVSAISLLTSGPQVIVGSSMGGWIALLCALQLPERVHGLVTIAAAPDFTEDSFYSGFTEAQREKLESDGRLELPSEYDDGPYVITQRLIEEGRENLVLRKPLNLPFASRFLQGTADEAVDTSVALRLLDHASGPNMRLTLVKHADHRFSSPECLALIEASIREVSEASH